jgi:pimeloyl-ACP methyl ester carboxylesterase
MIDDILPVPGAVLHYRMRGAGPLLLLMQGGGGDAAGTDSIAVHLEARHTVLTYDRRGLSASVLDDPDDVPSIGTHADDVHRLLGSLTTDPVPAFGTSFGAFVGLELVSGHPRQVSLLIAHEPPVQQLLPAAELAGFQALQRKRTEAIGRGEPTEALDVAMGMNRGERESGVELSPPTEQGAANALFSRTREIPTVDGHLLDIGELIVERDRIVPAVGATSTDGYAGRCTTMLAAALDVPTVLFPGSHIGQATHPRAFAAKLQQILDA